MALVIQSVLVPKNKYTLAQSKKWIADNHFKLTFYSKKEPDITENYYRYRQMAPSRFVKSSYITIDYKDDVKLIKGELK